MTASTFPALLQRFFTDRLCTQMEASANTIAGYRDTFRLLLRFASEQRRKPPTRLRIEDLDAGLIGDFLVHVETARQNGARSRMAAGRHPLLLPPRRDERAPLPAALSAHPDDAR